MKKTKITLMVITTIIIAACNATKKSTKSTAANTPTPTASPPVSSTPLIFLKPADGIYIPGDAELTAIKAKYNDVTLEKLKEGHSIYTEGACISCHSANNIYERGETQWQTIIDDMAQRAFLSEAQKDAVYKYVLSIKAVQPK